MWHSQLSLCATCEREYNEFTIEDYKHAMYYCPAVQTIRLEIHNTFFHHSNIDLDISDILLSIDINKGKAYDEDEGNLFTNLVWDLLQVYIIKCHSKVTTPTASVALFEIREHINRILKILPNCKLSTFLKASPLLLQALKV